MALENCVQLSTIRGVATKSCSNIQLPIISCREKSCNLPTFQRPLFPSLVSSKLFSRPPTSHKSSILFVCNASQAASQGTVQAVNGSNWDTLVLGSKLPVLVEFWAPWCGPCKMIAPVIDELAKEYSGKIECYKINTDECPAIATQYSIRSIPTVLVFKNGDKRDSIVGAVPKTTFATTIGKYLDA